MPFFYEKESIIIKYVKDEETAKTSPIDASGAAAAGRAEVPPTFDYKDTAGLSVSSNTLVRQNSLN